MANTGNNIGAALTTSVTDFYTVPADTVAYIIGLSVANVDGSTSVDATLQWTDASNSNAIVRLAYLVAVGPNDTRAFLVAPLILAAGDKLQGLASANGDAELTVSYYTESTL